ncbi:SDR family NAD(P)-dependent oxidoreductase [Embleya sp. NBC_00896]|uniref:SDR family NAD(P)-dependent oxidoreductase n=1 Tax=Embleya sp. NBC_00896 TaxID=2975961 RepID=UPI00386D2F15|nr:SDR family oxidoreductase [Embleya sp. NBC_00896]
MGTRRFVVVSGGGSGIGRAIARAFADRGDHVTVLGRRPEPIAAVAKEIGGAALALDLTDPHAVERARAELPEHVDVLVNNAGQRMPLPTEPGLAAIADHWRRMYDHIVLPAVLLTEAPLPRLARPGGRIVSIGSTAGLRGNNAYGAAKAAIHTWNHTLATRVGPDGITANVVIPGYIADTEFAFDMVQDAAEHARRAETTLVKRVGRPEDVAAAVVFVASPEAGYICGEFVNVSGGHVLGR